MTLAKITPQDTNMVFIGSGALSFPWYLEIATTGDANTLEPTDDWSVTFALPAEDEETPGKRYTLNHKAIMRAVSKIVHGGVRGIERTGTVREQCRILRRDGAEECDFDAGTADCVMQVAALGEVIYG